MRLGKDKRTFFLAVFLLLSASSSGQAGKSFKYQFDGNLQTINVITGTRSLIVNYSITEVKIENIVIKNGTFYHVTIPGHIPTSLPGKPEFPVFSRLITIPEGSGYKIKISEVRSSRINPSGKKIEGILYPVQEGETKNTLQQKPDFQIDKALYASRGFITSDTVSIEPLGKVRNNNIANLIISPVRYNPHSNIIEVITSMKVEISFSSSAGITVKSLLPESASFNESLIKGVINYNSKEVIPGYTDQPVKMVIITDIAFKKQIEPFLRWKTQKGFKIKVLYRGTEYAGNSYTQLKDTLAKIYRASSVNDPPPEYLLIVGDVSRVPYYGSDNVTDMYYGEFDGNGDYIPEMFIGRLPVADTSELKSVVNKIIQYEKFEFADTNKFHTPAIASAGYDAGYSSYMNGQVKYAISNYLTAENNIDEHHFYYPESENVKDSIIKLINKGVSFINYTGHGDVTGWLHLNIKSVDIPSFTNKNMYPFVISNACRTANYSIPGSFGNRMVVTADKGAIGYIGCSNDSYWDEDYYWAVGPGTITGNPTYSGKGSGAYDRLFHSHGESPSDWYFTMGQINYAGNLAVSASTSTRKKYYWETYNLVGDPSVIPIIGKPGLFNISLPDTLPNELKSLSLNIPPFAYIAISHFDTLWDASYASASGSVVLNMPGLSNDSCLVVITGQNKCPVIKTIHLADTKREYLNLTSSGIIDTGGNNNSRADYGEHIYLKLDVSNLGLSDAHNVYAKISSTSEWIKIINDSAFIGTLPSKSNIILSDKLGITVSKNAPDMKTATVNLVLKDDTSEKQYKIDILLHSPDLQIVSFTIDDTKLGNGDLVADPGETLNLVFKVNNYGSSDISGQFNVTSPPNGITILQPSIKSGVLKFGETTDIPITVKLSETVASGSSITLSAFLNCDQFLVNKDFSFRVGRIRESFEALSFNVFPWINISTIPWTVTSSYSYEGSVSAKSGAISHNGSSSLVLRTTYSEADSIKFSYKVSSEANYDFLAFKLNGVEILKKSGEVPWSRIAIPVPAGLNKMEWVYKKDQSVTAGADCAWIDMIDFAVTGSVNYIRKDLVVSKIVSPVQKDKYGLETITVNVLNIGRDTLKGFNLAYIINDQFPAKKQFFENQVIPEGDTVTVSFKLIPDLKKYGIYKIVAYGFNNNDDYINNDTAHVSIENTMIADILSVFPNPIKDQFTIFINSQAKDVVRITITGVSGVKLYEIEKEILSGKNQVIISDAKLLPGLYYLNIHGATINNSVPIMKINK